MRSRTPAGAWRRGLGFWPGALFILALGCVSPQTTRMQSPEAEDADKDLKVLTVGDVTDVTNVAPIALSGVGLVINLDGTGGGAPPGYFRTLLEEELRRRKVKNAKEMLDSPETAQVLVSALIPSGARKGDPIDVEVTLPPGSKATSLAGGYLTDCYLRDYNTTKGLRPNTDKPNALLPGHILARARGPLQVGSGDGDEEEQMRKARIWEGGVSFIDHPLVLVLKNDQKFARVAAAVADRINAMYQDDPRRQAEVERHKRLLVLDEVASQINDNFHTPTPGKGAIARAMRKDGVYVNVPWEYRLNPERYLRVVRLMPLRQAPDEMSRYRQKLQGMLTDPARTVRAALRLEALGKDSAGPLKQALLNPHPLVRFAAAEALTYLGSPAGAEELAGLARQYDQLRAYALMALASLDEPASRERLAELLRAPVPELRYGAFRALRLLDEQHRPEDQDAHAWGELLNDSFWLHRVAPQSPALVHFSLGQRAEVVLFGDGQQLVPPFRISVHEFTVTADQGDDRCTITHYMKRAGRVEPRQCSLRLDEVLRTLAALGGQYADVVELLRCLDELKAVSCPVRLNAMPEAPAVPELAASGRNADLWRFAPAAEALGGGHPGTARAEPNGQPSGLAAGPARP
jgi:hypothetical protein